MKKYLIIILLSCFITLNIVSKNKPVEINNKFIALSFDDGPSIYTDQILDILDKYDAQATFFVIGNKANNFKETLKKIVNNGNEIGNHTYTHKWLSTLNENEFLNEINKTNEIIKEITNFDIRLLRPTYGSISNKQKKLTDLDISFWDIDTLDWKIKNVDKIVNKVINKVKDLDVILMHDTYKRTVLALEIIIPELKKQGYEFITISELNQIKEFRKNKHEYL